MKNKLRDQLWRLYVAGETNFLRLCPAKVSPGPVKRILMYHELKLKDVD